MKYALLVGVVLIACLGVGCSPRGNADDTAAPRPSQTPTEQPDSTLPAMQIVTRTPVDPARIPPTATEAVEAVDVPATYVVQEGDTLYSIANQFQLNLAEIVALNGLSDPNDIVVGQELELPVDRNE